MQNKVGGGEGLVGIYGSMTQQGTCAILDAMAKETRLGPSSVLVDIGSGLCRCAIRFSCWCLPVRILVRRYALHNDAYRPLLHAILELRVKQTYGVELDPIKCQKAVPFIHHVSSMLKSEDVAISESSLPIIICSSVEQVGNAWSASIVDAHHHLAVCYSLWCLAA